jgi:ribonuclease BN (tRNA processing enzyme)
MRLDVLGVNGTYPERGGACSGYLLRDDAFALWMDAGTGTLARLQEHVEIDRVGGLFLSHTHADHMVDIYTFFYALWFHEAKPRSVPLIMPAGAKEYIGRLLSDDMRESFDVVFDVREVDVGDVTEIGPLRLSFFDSVHSAKNLSMRAESNGAIFCYSGDTGPNDDLPKAARNADLFLCEASWQRDTKVDIDPIHCRATEAGEAANRAGVARVMLTHIWPGLDRQRSAEEASQTFAGSVEIARAGEGTEIG